MHGSHYRELIAHTPPPCPIDDQGYCPAHAVVDLQPMGGRWCSVARRVALGAAAGCDRAAAQPPSAWWRSTAVRRMLWRRMHNDRRAAAAWIRAAAGVMPR